MRVSVVVPIYNVEPYLRACLESVAAQGLDDLEVIMVDDGSTDGSPAIAREFAERDSHFKLITQPNGGLGNARNNGAAIASGEFLAFLDSDDVVPPHAYELMLETLDKTGSDFATGNVHRLGSAGTSQTRFLARAFAETRLKTHVTRYTPLLADRIAPNKLWRMSFWREQGLRFPEQRLYEDIPVSLPAHFAARAVDVISDPVYLYRIREGADLTEQSITQRRLEPQALLDRIAAVQDVRDYLDKHGSRRSKRLYDKSIVAEDLSYFLNVLDIADDHFRELFLERMNALLDTAARGTYRDLTAIERLKWHLVRRRLMPELLEVLRFEKQRMRYTPPVRVGRRWYGDYPFRGDPRLRVPNSVYRLGDELAATSRVDDLRWEGDDLVVEGFGYVSGIGAPERGSQRVSVALLRKGRLRSVRLRTSGVRFKTSPAHRPDATASSRQAVADLEWSGFVARVSAKRLRRLGRWRAGTWDLYVTVRAGGVTRRRVKFSLAGRRPARAVDHTTAADLVLRASPTVSGEVRVEALDRWARVDGHRVLDSELELAGDLRASDTGKLGLVVLGPGLRKPLRAPLAVETADDATVRFTARVPLAELPGGDGRWDLFIGGQGPRWPVTMRESGPDPVWDWQERVFCLRRTQYGQAQLLASSVRAEATEASWTEQDELRLRGTLRAPAGPWELVLHSDARIDQRRLPLTVGSEGAFDAVVTPARLPTLGGDLPLRAGLWTIAVARPGSTERTPILLPRALYPELPLERTIGHKQFALGMGPAQEAVLAVSQDLDDSERGAFHQRRLRESAYRANRERGLEEAVVYSSFNGRQYSDNPRAIHEELVRRKLPLEHLWVVRDGTFQVPAGATALREGSREHYEAMAGARYVVTNDLLPDWFERRPDQLCVQTWHGTPAKRMGLHVLEARRAILRSKVRWVEQAVNWQYLLSPSSFATPLLREAFELEGELLETGSPRNDRLVRSDPGEVARVRSRLGVPEGARVVLYAPTYRDYVTDSEGRRRLHLHLDIDRLREQLGEDTVVLMRKHHRVSDLVPSTPDGFVRDVSAYPDATELMLAADVLITDYSSMMFDFALTGRPILLFAYDLELYRDVARGLYVDLAEDGPGPVLRNTDEIAAALSDLDRVRQENADRYERFAARFCDLDDGRAAARVVDLLFSG